MFQMKSITKAVVFCVILFDTVIASAQYRFIKAHSDLENRLLSTDASLLDGFRNNRQSPKLISSLVSLKNDTHRKINRFSRNEFDVVRWNNPEYFGASRTNFTSSKWIRNLGTHLWKNPNRFWSWESQDNKDYFVINPVLDLSYAPAVGSLDTFLLNGRGVELYGQMGDKLAFHSNVYDYQAIYSLPVDRYRDSHQVRPGITKHNINSFDVTEYFYATAYLDAKLLEKRNDSGEVDYSIIGTIGHDKQHIGSGFRSLILSNFAPPSMFAQIDYQLGPFKYQNLYKELVRDMTKDTTKTWNKKYLAMHRGVLEFDKIGLELGFSEMIVQTRVSNGLDWNYLNPVIFYRAIERDLNSPDNAFIAFDAKWSKNRWVWYGQLVLDEFSFGAMFGNRNSYLNKYGNQIGFYYRPKSEAFRQSFVQLEYNAVRPYMYSHNTSNYYSHYNQALAHPLESNFREITFRFFGVPNIAQKWSINTTGIVAWKGYNSNGQNVGSDFRHPYNTAVDRENSPMLQGEKQTRVNWLTTLAYYMQPNAKIEINHRYFQTIGHQSATRNYLGLSIKYNFTDTRESYLF